MTTHKCWSCGILGEEGITTTNAVVETSYSNSALLACCLQVHAAGLRLAISLIKRFAVHYAAKAIQGAELNL